MAKINNQAVIQKLIDELKLYPSADAIPTELAEKILPVFQVNSQDVNVSVVTNPKTYIDSTLNTNNKTQTVPAGKIWEVLHIAVKWIATATVGNRGIRLQIKDNTGESMWLTDDATMITASQTRYRYWLNMGTDIDDNNLLTGNNQHIAFTIPKGLILQEGWLINIIDVNGVDANDDFVFTLEVNEQDI